VRIAGNVLPGLTALASVPADPSTPLTVGVALARPHVAEEDAFLAAQADPASPHFRQVLTLDQVVARFGVPAARTDHVVAGLRAAGLTVDRVDATGDYVSATGTVAAVQRAFGVEERRYTAGGTTFLANTAGPLVDPADGVLTVVGLNTLQHFTRPADVPHTSSTPLRPSQDTCQAGTCLGNTTPQDLWSVYGQPAAYEGQGVRMAIIGEGDPKNLLGYLRTQEAAYGLPPVPFTVHCVQSNDCGTDIGGDGEWQIDTQASGGMAPRSAGEELYFAKSIYDPDLNNSFIAWAQDPAGPTLASASLGECESSPANGVFTGPLGPTDANLGGGPGAVQAFGNGEAAAVDPVLKTAVMMGKTLFASTGDTGSSCPVVVLPLLGAGNGVLNQGVPQQNYPAVSPDVVAVGGTVLYTNDNGSGAAPDYVPGRPPATRALEYAWPFGGGGASLYQPAPAWQRSTPNVTQPCLIGADGSPAATGQLCRGVPDVAAQSGDVATNGYSVDGANGFTAGGGTSLSSPLWMGMWARVQGAAGRNLGFASPLLYDVGNDPAAAARDFFDITVGGNGLHTASTGWDYVTGFGVPNVAGLIADLALRPTTSTGPTPPAAPSPGAGGPGTVVSGSRSLASTGASLALPALALALLLGAVGLRRLRRA
jgi:subtilase family serine protease